MVPETFQRHSLTLSASATSADDGSAWARALAEKQGLAEERVYALDLCIIELVSNVVDHSSAGNPGEVRLDLDLGAGAAILTTHDTGPAFDPLAYPAPTFPTTIEDATIGG